MNCYLLVFYISFSFSMLPNSVFGSLPKSNSNADSFSLVCWIVRITPNAKSRAFPKDSLALQLGYRFSFDVLTLLLYTLLSTKPVGEWIYGVPYFIEM